MDKILKFFEGKRTFLCAAAIFLISGSEGIGWIDKEMADVLRGLFLAGGLAALRAAKT